MYHYGNTYKRRDRIVQTAPQSRQNTADFQAFSLRLPAAAHTWLWKVDDRYYISMDYEELFEIHRIILCSI